MIDSVLAPPRHGAQRRSVARLGLDEGGYGLLTLHRPALVDDVACCRRPSTASCGSRRECRSSSRSIRGRATVCETGLDAQLAGSGVHLTDPLGYLDFLGLESAARFVLTDSGGVQEETTALGVRCFTLRDTTERPVTVERGTNIVLGERPDRIAEIPALLDRPVPTQAVPLWDGRAGDRAAAAILAAAG